LGVIYGIIFIGVGVMGIFLGLKNMDPWFNKIKTAYHVLQWVFWVLIPVAIGVIYGWWAADLVTPTGATWSPWK